MADRVLSSGAQIIQWARFQADPTNLPMSRPGAYRIVHVETGKCYVGISQNVKKRLQNHPLRSEPTRIANAMRKHGRAAFFVEPLYYSLSDTAHLPALEALLIVQFDAIVNGYNIVSCNGTVGPYGPLYNAIQKEAQNRPETKAKRAATFAIPEVKARHKASMQAASMLISTIIREIVKRPGYIERMSEIGKECQMRPDVRARKAEGARAAHQRPESAAHYSDYYSDADAQALRHAAVKAGMATPEAQDRRLNRRARKDSASGLRGVRITRQGRFGAYIVIKRKFIHLGTFDTAEDAHESYREAAKEFYGDRFKG